MFTDGLEKRRIENQLKKTKSHLRAVKRGDYSVISSSVASAKSKVKSTAASAKSKVKSLVKDAKVAKTRITKPNTKVLRKSVSRKRASTKHSNMSRKQEHQIKAIFTPNKPTSHLGVPAGGKDPFKGAVSGLQRSALADSRFRGSNSLDDFNKVGQKKRSPKQIEALKKAQAASAKARKKSGGIMSLFRRKK